MLKVLQKWFGKWLLLSILWFVLNSIDFVHLQLNNMSQTAIIGRVIMAIFDSVILCWILAKSRTFGMELVAVIFLALFDVKILMTVIEAVYLSDLRPLVMAILLNGLIACLLWSTTAVALTVGFTQNEPNPINNDQINWIQKWFQLLYKLLLLAMIWMVLFVLGGLVFMNLAKMFDPQAFSNYSNLDMPAWVLPFQGLRALLWILLALPLIKQLKGKKIGLMIISGCIFAIWMGSNLLLALDLPIGLRYAHLVEVMVENFVFGGLAVLIFARNPENVPI